MKQSESRTRRWLWNVATTIILIGVAFVIVRHLPRIVEHLRQIDTIDAVIATVLLFSGYVLYAIRWQGLLIHQPGFLPAFQTANVGQMVNMWIPSRLGIVARSLILNRRESIPAAEVTASVAVERWLELVLQVTALGGALVLGTNLGLPLPVLILIMLVILTSLVGLLFWVVKHHAKIVETWPPRLGRLPRLTEEKVHQGLSVLLAGLVETVTARRLLVGFLWSVIMWCLFFGYFNVTIRAINPNFSPNNMIAVALGALGLAPPSVPRKPWTYVAVIVAAFSLFGFNTGTITAYALALVVLQAILVTALGLWSWTSQPVITLNEIWSRSKKKEE